MTKNIKTLLFRNSPIKIQLAGKNTGNVGPAGIKSDFRPERATGAAKYSTVGLALDKIFIDKEVDAYENSEHVFVTFLSNGTRYACFCNGIQNEWVGEAPVSSASLLLPIVVYTLSDGYYGYNKDELIKCFKKIKENENVEEEVLKFCDSFYYGFVMNENHEQIENKNEEIDKNIIKEAIKTNVLTHMKLFDGLSNIELGMKESLEEIEPLECGGMSEQTYKVEYNFWDEDQNSRIPSETFLDTYVQTDITTSIAKKIKYRLNKVIDRINSGISGIDAIGSDYINLLLVGRPATGKTSLANAVAAMTGLPIYEIPFSKNTEEDIIEGKNKVKEGKIDFVETEFLKAYEHGGIIVCEEINLADPAVVMGSMGQAIEYPFVVMKDGYIPVRRHPLCVIIGTMNTGTAGSKQLNQALSSRFKCTYILDDPTKETFISILSSKGYEKNKCKYVYEAYTRIMEFLKDPHNAQEELCENITLRGCFGALECMEEGEEPKEALRHSLIGKIGESDLEAAAKVNENVIETLNELGSTRGAKRLRRVAR